jgi:hypothetical protein
MAAAAMEGHGSPGMALRRWEQAVEESAMPEGALADLTVLI